MNASSTLRFPGRSVTAAPVGVIGSSALDRRATSWAPPDPAAIVLDRWAPPSVRAVVAPILSPWPAPDASMRINESPLTESTNRDELPPPSMTVPVSHAMPVSLAMPVESTLRIMPSRSATPATRDRRSVSARMIGAVVVGAGLCAAAGAALIALL